MQLGVMMRSFVELDMGFKRSDLTTVVVVVVVVVVVGPYLVSPSATFYCTHTHT